MHDPGKSRGEKTDVSEQERVDVGEGGKDQQEAP